MTSRAVDVKMLISFFLFKSVYTSKKIEINSFPNQFYMLVTKTPFQDVGKDL